MKFTCDRDTILREISVAQEIISSRNSLSILSNVLLEADNGTLVIKATDLKVGFETSVPVEVTVPGSTTVFCDKFLGILRSLPEGDVEFELDASQRLVIRPLFKRIDFQLKSIASEKFPELQTIEQDAFFTFPQKDFIEMISQTVFAVSDDETRYFMNGVFLEQQDGKVAMIATDGRRLSYVTKPLTIDGVEFPSVIIPPKVLNLVRKLSSREGDLSLAVSPKSVFIRFDSQKVSSALIEGQFPNYQKVIPERQEFAIQVNRLEFMEALKRVSLLVEQKSRRVYLHAAENILTVTSEESEIGVAKEELVCRYDGPEITIALNYLYLMDPFKVMEDEEVSIRFTEPNKALTIYPVPEKDFFHIVMPMQLD